MKRLIYFHFIVLLTSVKTATAQNWQTYYNQDTRVTVQAFSAPYLWYSSIKGLSRRNVQTNEVITFTPENSPLTSPIISPITVISVKANQVWVGTEHGIGVYNGTDWIFYPRSLYTPYQEGVSAIAFHPDGSVWVSGLHSIARFDGVNWKIYGASDGLPYVGPDFQLFHVENIRITDTGIVWINTGETNSGMNSTTKGLIKYENNNFTIFPVPGHATENIYDFDLIFNNLIITTDAGTYQVEGNQVTHSYTRNNAPLITWGDGVINGGGISAGAGNYFWTNVDNNLIKIQSTGEITEYSYESLEIQYVLGIAEESPDVFWLGTSEGLKRKSNDAILSIPVVTGIPNIPTFFFRNMVVDINGNVWMGTTGNGLIRKSGNNWSVFGGLPSNSIIESLATDKNGNVWTGWYAYDANNNFSVGLAKISIDESVTQYNTSNSALPGNFINQLAFDKDNNLWASLGNGENDQFFYKGLCKITISGNDITNITSIQAGPNGPSQAYPSDMIVDYNNIVWLSYFGHPANQWQSAVPALSKYDGTTWTHYNYQNSNLPSMEITGLALSNQGDLYTLNNPWDPNGGAGKGLTRFNGKNSIVYALPSGFGITPSLADIAFDKNGKFWITANTGVASFSLTDQVWQFFDAQNSPFPKYFSNTYSHSVSKVSVDAYNTKYFNCTNGAIGKDGLVMYNEAGLITKQNQTTSFNETDKTFVNGLVISLEAMATSGLPVSFQLMQGQAILNGSELTVNGPGQITIKATQIGDNSYNAAQPVTVTFCINPVKLIIGQGESKLFVPVNLGEVKWYKDNQPVTNPSTIPTDFYPTENGSYQAKLTVAGCFTFSDAVTINRQTQSITIEQITDKPFVAGLVVSLQATATSGLPVSFQLMQGQAILNGSELTVNGPGQITIKATQIGDNSYNAAQPVTVTFCVNPTKPVIGKGDDKLFIKISFGEAQWYKDNSPLTNPSNGPTEFYPIENGSYQVKVTVNGCSTISDTVMVNRQSQSITIEEITDKIFGETSTITVVAHSTSGLPVSLQLIKGNVQLTGNTVTINAAGEVEIEATQTGGLHYYAANPTSISFCINPLKPIVQIENATSLKATLSEGSWQWYLNDVLLPGAVQDTYQPLDGQTGNYKVKVVQENCFNFSDPVVFTVTGVEQQMQNSISIFPNPAAKVIYVQSDSNEKIFYTITSILGLELKSGLLSGREIDVSDYHGQLILVTLKVASQTIVKKVIVK